jgi:predicted patatin/cPLA2 family phospholipase
VRGKIFVQGGGMRGVYSLGALARLEQLGLTHRFDVVEGSSAGAINGAYFITGQAEKALGIYAEMAAAKEFIRYSRVHRILNVDFLIDTVLKRDNPLRLNDYWDSPIEMRTVVTDASTAQPFVVTNRMRDIDVYELLRATAAAPLLYHRKIALGAGHYVDGGVSRSMPYLPDLATGGPFLALLTQPLGFRVLPPKPLVRFAIALRSGSMSAHVTREMRENYAIYNSTMKHLEDLEAGSPVRVVAPTRGNPMAPRITRDPALIQATIRQATIDLERTIDGWDWL